MFPPRILIIFPEQWPRADLKSELVDKGYEVLGATDLMTALSYAAFEKQRGPVRYIVVDQSVLAGWNRGLIDLLMIRHQGPDVVLVTPALTDVLPGPWSHVLVQPVSVQDLVELIENEIPIKRRTFHLPKKVA